MQIVPIKNALEYAMSSMPTFSVCRLCSRTADLKNSHVIPKTFFTQIKRSGPALLAHDDILMRNRTTQDSWSQKLLCGDCELKLAEWEAYSIEVLRRPSRKKVIVRKSPKEWEFFNVDYSTFRLFQVSVLFRAAVSTRVEYQHVALDGNAVQRMQYILNSGEAPPVNEFPCLMEVIRSPSQEGSTYTQVIGAPRTLSIGAQTYYWFVFGGFCWYFVFPKMSREELAYQSYLSRAGYMRLPALHVYEHPWLNIAVTKAALKSQAGWRV